MIGRVIHIVSLKSHFNIKFDQHSVERSRLPPNLQIDKELVRELWSYFAECWENLSWDFEATYIFQKKEVSNRGPYLKRFCTYKRCQKS